MIIKKVIACHLTPLHFITSQPNSENASGISLAQINARIHKALEIHELAPSKKSESHFTNAVIQKRDKIYEIHDNISRRKQFKI